MGRFRGGRGGGPGGGGVGGRGGFRGKREFERRSGSDKRQAKSVKRMQLSIPRNFLHLHLA